MSAVGTPAVSIIVPVYNVEKYLPGCLQSIRAQSFTDYELILVDDGSTDCSGAICDKAAEEGAVVMHQSNLGPSAARNAGLAMARGRYVCFIDSDDMIAPEYLAALMEIAESTGSEIAAVGMRRLPANGDINPRGSRGVAPDNLRRSRGAQPAATGRVSVMSGEEAARLSLYQRGGIDNSVWGKLFRASLWHDLRFREGIIYEDLDVVYKVMLKAGKVAMGSARLYYYRRNPYSLLREFKPRRADVLDVTDEIVKYADEECPALSAAARSRKLSANFNMLLLFTRNGCGRGHVAARCRRNIKALRGGCLRDPQVRLKNKLGILLSPLLLLMR